MEKVVYLIVLSALLFSISSCTENNVMSYMDDSNVEAVLEKAKLRILSVGLDTADVVEVDGYYVVENDILINKDSLLKYPETRQYHATYYVPNEISISIGGNSTITSASGWIDAIKEVIKIYNKYTGLNFYYSSNPDILISKKNVGTFNVCAQGEFPTSSNSPGKNVYINTQFYQDIDTYLSHEQKVFLLMHEIGHNLGLRHTNCAVNGEGTSTVGMVKIPGTPDTDVNSYMKSHTCGNSWNGMPQYDGVALKYLWPKFITISLYGIGEHRIEYGSILNISEPTPPEGKTTFRGWFYDEGLMRSYNNEPLYNDTTLYPKWTVVISAYHVTGSSGQPTYFTIEKPTLVKFSSYLSRGLNNWSDVLSVNKVCASLIYPSSSPIVCDVYTQDYKVVESYSWRVFEKDIMLSKTGTYVITANFPLPDNQGGSTGMHGNVTTNVEY